MNDQTQTNPLNEGKLLLRRVAALNEQTIIENLIRSIGQTATIEAAYACKAKFVQHAAHQAANNLDTYIESLKNATAEELLTLDELLHLACAAAKFGIKQSSDYFSKNGKNPTFQAYNRTNQQFRRRANPKFRGQQQQRRQSQSF